MRTTFVTAIVLLGVIGSAVAITWTNHVRRSLFGELDQIDAERDRIQIEWGQLQIEQSTWAESDRIEGVASEKLDLHASRASSTVIVVAE